jgi:hypothetical protein
LPTNFSPLGLGLFGDPIQQRTKSPVAQRFLVAPFSVLSARDGEWQDRKRAWVSMGIKGEESRENAKSYNGHAWYEAQGLKAPAPADGVSLFDPVVCELVYKWFSAGGAQIVDPFAGGSVRGVVASCLGRNYWGSELRIEQVLANREQAEYLCPELPPIYVHGDSIDTLDNAPAADLIFSCPPYGDLEKYSDDPADLSNMEWHTFLAAYKRIIMRSCKVLKDNRFACFVVGDFRDKRGFYRDFVSETIKAFKEQGLELYNEAILVTAVGSAAMRVTKQFSSGRKFCKTHQNILVFCKGDWRKAAEYLNAGESV